MYLSFIIVLTSLFVGEQSTAFIVPSKSTAKLYVERGKQYTGIHFKRGRKILSSFHDKNALNVRLTPLDDSSLLDGLNRASELIITITLSKTLREEQSYLLRSFLVQENPITGTKTRIDPLDSRIIQHSFEGAESIALPALNASILPHIYVKICLTEVNEKTQKERIRLQHKVNTELLLVIRHVEEGQVETPSLKSTRSIDEDGPALPCRRGGLIVNFQAIGWGSWVLAPKSVNIFQCHGSCHQPNVFYTFITGNAIVRSLMSTRKRITKPCCIPSRLRALSVLTKNSNELEDHKLESIIVDS